MLQPSALRPGDLIALVSPSGWMSAERAAVAEKVLTGWGLRVRVGEHALKRHWQLAGTDEQRLGDLNTALRDPEVRGVLCMRGGYGAQRIADGMDLAAVRADPKLFLGFSDVTALHLALWTGTGLATVHGPTASSLDRGAASATAIGLRHTLMTAEPVVLTASPAEDTFPVRVPGRAEGILLGGNLALLASTAGTPHTPDLRGAILLLEDVNEKAYAIDRALVQLRRAGWLDKLAGVAVGQFAGCEPAPAVNQVLAEQLGALGVPVLGGLPIGHGEQQTALGHGVPAVLDADAGTLVTAAVAAAP